MARRCLEINSHQELLQSHRDQVLVLVKSPRDPPCNLHEQFLAYVLEY